MDSEDLGRLSLSWANCLALLLVANIVLTVKEVKWRGESLVVQKKVNCTLFVDIYFKILSSESLQKSNSYHLTEIIPVPSLCDSVT